MIISVCRLPVSDGSLLLLTCFRYEFFIEFFSKEFSGFFSPPEIIEIWNARTKFRRKCSRLNSKQFAWFIKQFFFSDQPTEISVLFWAIEQKKIIEIMAEQRSRHLSNEERVVKLKSRDEKWRQSCKSIFFSSSFRLMHTLVLNLSQMIFYRCNSVHVVSIEIQFSK